MKRLENKTAVIYGAGGIGAAVARAFVKAGARVFLANRSAAKLDAIAKDIRSAGGSVETALLDTLDEQAVELHMQEIIKLTGKIDISFNTIGIPMTGVQGIPLHDLDADSFFLPIATYIRSHFITGKAAAKRMIGQGSGTILMHTSNASRINPPFVGGMSPAWAALESLSRSQSVEWGPKGVRAVCLMTTGMPETPLIDEVWEIHGKLNKIEPYDFNAIMVGMTHRGKLTTLDELTAAAVFVASDEGSAITGAVINLTGGMITT